MISSYFSSLKTNIWCTSVRYCRGCSIRQVKIDPEKVKAVVKWPVPMDMRQLQCCCHLTWRKGSVALLHTNLGYQRSTDLHRTPAPQYRVGQKVWLRSGETAASWLPGLGTSSIRTWLEIFIDSTQTFLRHLETSVVFICILFCISCFILKSVFWCWFCFLFFPPLWLP